MINKIENKLGTFLNLSCTPENDEKMINDYVKEIKSIKLFPFSKVFIKVPLYSFEKFILNIKNNNIQYKTVDFIKNTALVEI